MVEINGVNMKNFSYSEFPEGELEYVDYTQLEKLQQFRTILGARIRPSKVPGALSRLDGSKTSDHKVLLGSEGQLLKPSTGIDVFCNTHIFKAWTVALTCGLWDAVGVYFDTHDNEGLFHPMLHLGQRSHNAIWLRDYGKYKSPYKTKEFYAELLKQFKYVSGSNI